MQKSLLKELRYLLVLPLFFLSVAGAVAQGVTVKGKVTDANGQSLPGVTVVLKGTSIAAPTDFDGNYMLNLPNGNGTLIFSFIGYQGQEVPVNNRTTINVSLADDAKALDEVVVVGYATQEKKDLTGSVAIVDVAEMTKQPAAQVSSMLQGRAAGVTVLGSGQPGAAQQIRIRGFNTFGNNSPLYVVDGVPTQNINDINPNDIESMQVLKDAGSASIYGSRAANGVVIITTRRGKDKITVQYDGYYGTQRPPSGNVWNLANPQEMADLTWRALRNTNPDEPISHPLYGSGEAPVLPDYLVAGSNTGLMEGDPRVDPSLYNLNPNYTGGSSELNSFYRIVRANKEGTEWFHEIFKPAPITSHNIAVSGGGDIGKYYFSANYFDQKGTLANTYFKRFTVRSNSTFNLNKKIRVGENLAYSIIDNPTLDLSGESVINHAYRQQTIIPVHDIMGNYAGSSGNGLGNADNPVAILDRRRNNEVMNTRLFGNVFVEADIIEDFTLRTSFGGELYHNTNNSFTFPEYESAENSTFNQFEQNANNGYNWTWTNTLSYHKTLNDVHDLKVLVGTEAYNNFSNNLGGVTQGYFSFDPNFTNLSTGSGTQTNSSSRSSDALYSLIGRIDYNLMDKYLLGFVIRRDGSSRFLNNQYGTFPAVSAGWRISQEGFMQNVSWVSDLKLRGGYGVMGNQLNVDPSNAFTTYGQDRNLTFYDINGTNNSTTLGFRQARIGNPDAKWETNVNSNIGFDATLFNGKLDVTADYYSKEIRDLLYNPELPGTAGAATVPYVNIAKIQNKGFDAAITGHIEVTSDLRFDLTGTITTYKNKILKVSNGAQNFDLESRRFNGNYIIRNQVGSSMSSFFGYQIEGFWDDEAEINAANEQARAAANDPNAVYQTDVKVGRFRYADINDDGQITADDRTILGSPNPDFTYGLNIAATYKNFDFTMFLYGSQGNEIWNQVKWWTDFYTNFAGAKSKTAVYDSWTPENHDATAPIQENVGSFSTSTVPNSYYVENGSYLRAKNAQIGYSLPASLTSKYGIGRLRVYVQAANLFTITKYSGVDPEITGYDDTGGVKTTGFGIDEGNYPNMRQYLFGLNVSF
ncbi:SusC/RagA family TonB-linked outer membrane protein [Pontibacter silvestris]|uniref:SusC/RagA family TonB-linked outer membrane protein n=1 Tax=Pontibacter silvestris TaxID=2305183 RepID=A0ABW4X2G2_9BACT|nr:TonB-dependent receptor [Pontibacter silvestris]MCC9134821.1 TonB-dependent receptor [Pontibacter silvestris]